MSRTLNKEASFAMVILTLSMAQFIMTVDTTIMNVSVPTLVEDLSTSVSLIQAAIAIYALVMASFMLIGGKLGEIYGRKRMFRTGLVIYGIGSLITAMAPNVWVLIFGWSILEGLGASLMMPAMMALISNSFTGAKRVTALGITAGVAGAAAALGPIIGGALSTYASWRYAFYGEVVIALFTLFLSTKLIDKAKPVSEKLDIKGASLAALGLAFFVGGILQAGTYGWFFALQPFEIGSFSFEPFGLSITPFISGLGLLFVWLFFRHEKAMLESEKPVLLKVNLLEKINLRSGLSLVLITQLVLGGTLFVMPLFLQLVLGYSAIKSGVALLPVSVGLIALSAMSAKLAKNITLTKAIKRGQLLVAAGLGWLILAISNDTETINLIAPFLLLGAGIGLLIPLVQTVVLGSVESKDSSQAAGLNYTYQQLGMSLGTAVIGSILLFALGSGIVSGLSQSEQFDQALVEAQSTTISANVEFVDNDTLVTAAESTDLSPSQVDEIVDINTDARLRALRIAVGAALIVHLFGYAVSGRIGDQEQKA